MISKVTNQERKEVNKAQNLNDRLSSIEKEMQLPVAIKSIIDLKPSRAEVNIDHFFRTSQ
jgi:hypothetical protein